MEKNERTISLIIVHCSATRCDRDITAADICAAHRVRGYRTGGYHYYIRKNGKVEKMRPESEVGAHCFGYNTHSIGVCYEGGLDSNGRPADTRTQAQSLALQNLLYDLLMRYPGARIVGHRDLSPDLNLNGWIEPWERIKVCPCFDAKEEYKGLEFLADLEWAENNLI